MTLSPGKPPLRQLRPYQDRGVDFLLDTPKAALWVDMGLGKTAIILHALLDLLRSGEVKGKVLLIAPLRVVETVWEQEAQEWVPTRGLRFSVLRGTPKQRKEAASREADIYMCNPELLEEALKARSDYEVLVIDESTLFKNPSTKRFKMLRKHLRRFSRVIEATGTPTPNGLEDLWSQIFLLDQGDRLFSSVTRFRNHYFYQTDYLGYKRAPHDWAKEDILSRVSDLIFRIPRDSEEMNLGLKEPLENLVRIPLPDRARKLYDQMEKRALMSLRGVDISAPMAATKFAKLRQIAGGFVYDEEGKPLPIHKEKLKATREIVEGTGSPVIVVYQFQEELRLLREEFPEGVVFGRPGGKWTKPGGLAAKHRDAWNRGEIPILFLHPQSGGHGLNLQFGGHVMVIYSGSFSLEQMDQVRKRIDRPGQKEVVVYHWLLIEDSVDFLLLDVIQTRSGDQSQVLSLIKEYADGKKHHNRRPRRGGEVEAGVDPGLPARKEPRPHLRAKAFARGPRKRAGDG